MHAGDKKIGKVITALNSSGLLLAAGIATSLRETGQQWLFFIYPLHSVL
jgi:alpha,alpha-trehalase